MVDVGWLRGLGEDGLAALLERRPEALAAPVPGALSEVAERLDESSSVLAVMRRLSLPTVQVAEVVAALGGTAVERAGVWRLLDPARRPEVQRSLAELAGLGLLTGDSVLTLVEPARYAFGSPLALGPPAAALLAPMTAEDLRSVLRTLDIRPPGRKAEILAAVLDALRDADRVRSVVAGAPGPVRGLLAEVASTGRPVEELSYFSFRHSRPTRPAHWALAHGLLLPTAEWRAVLAMPAEVALALRGEGWTAPFDPDPPAVERIPVEPSAVDREATAAGGSLLRIATGLLDTAGRTPVAVLRGGGIGVRELRRLTRTIGCSAAELTLALSVAEAAGLLALSGAGATPSDRYDDWLAGEPPERLATLLSAWWSLPYVPCVEPEAAWRPTDEGAAALRVAVLAEADREPGASPTGLAALVRWRRPYGLGAADPGVRLETTWAEAALVGAAGAGGVSTAGRALLRGRPETLPAALAGVGAAVDVATFQSDLTAVVAGTPSARLAALLDRVADRETSGVASVWRFGPQSVRRAFDAGHGADELVTRLTEAASTGLPQPLGYLIRDVARRHGRIRGQEVGCCLRSADQAGLAELAADRRLRTLGLRLVAPTVLVGEQPLAETLAALRAAGYAPVEEDADGDPVWEPEAAHRVPAAARPRPAPPRSEPPDPRALARAMLDRADTAVPTISGTLRAIRAGAVRLSLGEARLLAHSVDTGSAVRVVYQNRSGATTHRIIEDLEFDGSAIDAWCRLRDDQRRFSLSGILAVERV